MHQVVREVRGLVGLRFEAPVYMVGVRVPVVLALVLFLFGSGGILQILIEPDDLDIVVLNLDVRADFPFMLHHQCSSHLQKPIHGILH